MKIALALREETKKYLSTLTEVQKEEIIQFIEKFLNFSAEKAFFTLVKIKTSNSEEIVKKEKLQNLKPNMLLRFYNDLTTNYRILHPKCWLNKIDKQNLDFLLNAVEGDATILYLIKRKVEERMSLPIPLNMEIIELLLNAKEENYRFYGLKELNFSDIEAKFLLNITKEIYKYILNKEKLERKVKVIDENCAIRNPICEEFVINIISNSEIITEFLNEYDIMSSIMERLKIVKISPEIIIKNQLSIKNLLKAASEL